MELLSVIRARSIWLIYLQDLNPRGKNINVHLIEWLRNQYSFLKCPSSLYDRDVNQALVFTDGTLQSVDGSLISVDLSIYNDGLIADARSSTRDTDIFIENILNSAVRDFGIVYKPEMIRQKLYVSELSLRSERPLSNINPKMQAFVRKIVSMVGANDARPLEFASLSLWWDPASPSGQSHFQFERTVGTPFSERRYYSRAPLHTDDHLKLLDEFEDLILG